jgi:hypothetical protein
MAENSPPEVGTEEGDNMVMAIKELCRYGAIDEELLKSLSQLLNKDYNLDIPYMLDLIPKKAERAEVSNIKEPVVNDEDTEKEEREEEEKDAAGTNETRTAVEKKSRRKKWSWRRSSKA